MCKIPSFVYKARVCSGVRVEVIFSPVVVSSGVPDRSHSAAVTAADEAAVDAVWRSRRDKGLGRRASDASDDDDDDDDEEDDDDDDECFV